MRYNIAYEKEDGRTFYYLCEPVTTLEEARKWLNKFKDKYVDKPYPNGKGFYKVRNPRIVGVS
jgi:hypothetical protein